MPIKLTPVAIAPRRDSDDKMRRKGIRRAHSDAPLAKSRAVTPNTSVRPSPPSPMPRERHMHLPNKKSSTVRPLSCKSAGAAVECRADSPHSSALSPNNMEIAPWPPTPKASPSCNGNPKPVASVESAEAYPRSHDKDTHSINALVTTNGAGPLPASKDLMIHTAGASVSDAANRPQSPDITEARPTAQNNSSNIFEAGFSTLPQSALAEEPPPISASSSSAWSSSVSLGSSLSSNYDPVSHLNARQFPPRLPAAPTQGLSGPQNRFSAIHHIASWVSRHEDSQDPERPLSTHVRPRKTLEGFALEQDGSEQNDSEDSDRVPYAQVENLWQQLKEKRSTIVAMKTDMAGRRRELRALRRRKDNADNNFMSLIRPMLVSDGRLPHASVKMLGGRMALMQSLRDDYHFEESAYEKLELSLDEEEKDLNTIELRFFSLLAAGQAGTESDEGRSIYPSDAPYDLIGISPDGPAEDLHPLYLELTSTLGDLENLKEEYSDLLSLKQQYEHELDLDASIKDASIKDASIKDASVNGASVQNTSIKFNVSDDAKEFLEEFPAEEADKKANITQLEADVKRLKKLCEEQRVMRQHMSIRMEYALNPNMDFEDLDLEDESTILARHNNLAHGNFTELLSQPDHLLAKPQPLTPQAALAKAAELPVDHPEKRAKVWLASKEFAIDSLMHDRRAGSTGDLINRWLLQQLRLSPLNVLLLYSTFVTSQSLRIQDKWRWQCDVVHYWWTDDTTSLDNRNVRSLNGANNSERSSRLGTPQQSRAASDAGLRHNHLNHHRNFSGSAITAR